MIAVKSTIMMVMITISMIPMNYYEPKHNTNENDYDENAEDGDGDHQTKEIKQDIHEKGLERQFNCKTFSLTRAYFWV